MPARLLTAAPANSPAYTRPRQSTAAFLGDSLTAGATAVYNYGDAYPTYVAPASGGRIIPAGFYGVGGQRSDQILQRVQLALATRPTYLAILAGTNDIGQGISTGKTDAQILDTLKANLRAMYRAAEAVGTVPVAITLPPLNDVSNTYRKQILLQKVNLWLHRHAVIKGYPLVDFFSLCANDGVALANPGTWKTQYALDGTHPNAVGCAAMGNLFATTLLGATQGIATPWTVQDTTDANRLVSGTPNPLWSSNSGNPGKVPDSTGPLSSITDTHTVYSLTTDGVLPGRFQQIAFDSSATILSAGLSGGCVATSKGDIVAISGYYTADGWASVQAQLVLGGTTYKALSAGLTSYQGPQITRGFYYMEVAAPATAGQNTNLFNLLAGARSGQATTVAFSYPTIVNLTQLLGETTPITPN